MPGFISDKPERERELTDMQQCVLDNLWDCGGDPVKAAIACGYTHPHRAVASLKKELIEAAEDAMARLAPKSVHKIEEVMDSDGTVKQANEKLKAAQLILERTNPKTDRVHHEGEVKQGIFILPEKQILNE